MGIVKETESSILSKIIKTILNSLYTIFVLALMVNGIVMGLITLIPDNAKKPCYLGYYAHCSFTPYSTIILFIMALFGAILLIKQIKYIKHLIKAT